MSHRVLIFLLTSFIFLPACGQQNMDKMLDGLYRHTVPLIQPGQLDNWLRDKNDLVLLDTRSKEEFQVSHLKGSELIEFESLDTKQFSHIPKSSTVVLYCSVGYRSERVGERMKELGFTEVYNLYGGLFNWKNQGRQVVNSLNQSTDSVHAYNRVWGEFLKKGIKVYD